MGLDDAVKSFAIYLKSEKIVALNTLEAYQRDILKLQLFLQKTGINSWCLVDQNAILAFIAGLKEQKLASASLARCLVVVKIFFKFLHREQIIKENSAEFLDSPKLWQKIPNILTEAEIQKLFSLSFENKRDKAILEMLYSVGLRVSELCSLNLYSVSDHEVKIRGKGNKERVVPIGKKAVEALDDYLATREGGSVDEPLFLGRFKKRIDRVAVWKIVKQYVNRAGITKIVTPHTFRHSYASHILNKGADIRVIQELLGHASITSTDRYTHVNSHQLKSAFESFHPRFSAEDHSF